MKFETDLKEEIKGDGASNFSIYLRDRGCLATLRQDSTGAKPFWVAQGFADVTG